ncbi:MAG: glutathione binding-like protein [Gammaproteobacteria bacterium]|nr:glutathione binding-like protein [Gammaproteobacteria bacterium]
MAGNDFICGDRMTLADILLYCFLEFGSSGRPALESRTTRTLLPGTTV